MTWSTPLAGSPRRFRTWCRDSCRNGCWRLLATLCLLSLSAVAAEDPGDPADVVRGVAGRMVDALTERREEFTQSQALLEELVRAELLPALDIEYSARLILGRAGRGASDEQIRAFAEAMSDVLVARYAEGLIEYRDREQVEVLPTRGELNERMTRVRTRVRLLNGNFIPVDYVFRLTEGDWKAFDVIVEGISYVTTYRGQIMPQVQESGIDTVTQRLRSGELELTRE